jgi:glutathione S-transferase
MITCYAFADVPPFARGVVRDLRVRWALEEARLPYRVTLVGERAGAVPPAAYRSIQPFGQVPAIEDGDLASSSRAPSSSGSPSGAAASCPTIPPPARTSSSGRSPR